MLTMAPLARDAVRRLASLGEAALKRIIARMSPEDLLRLDSMFEAWASEGQLEPRSEGWRTWLMMAGRGFGKTRAGAEWVHRCAMAAPGRRIALVAATIDEARLVMVEGQSGLKAVAARRGVKLRFEPGSGLLHWPNGSVARLFSGENPEGLRGPEHHLAWCDELAKWRRAEECWDNLQMGLRLGARSRTLVTTTPRPMALLERLRGEEWTVETGGRTRDNLSLPQHFIDVMYATYGDMALGRQELEGELLGEAEGSLFPRKLIEACRVPMVGPDGFDRLVVAIDPPASANRDSDWCGIAVAGRKDGKTMLLADCSVRGVAPERWGRRAIETAAAWGASLVIAEANNGGNMIESVLKAAGADEAGIRVRLVHARHGKGVRAEPVAAWMAAGMVKLAGMFPELEAQLSGLKAGGEYDGPGRSPDRADAAIWAIREMTESASGVPRVRRL